MLLPPVLAGAAVTGLLAALALTVANRTRVDAPTPLARSPASGGELAIGLSLELGVTARLASAMAALAGPRPGTANGAAATKGASLADGPPSADGAGLVEGSSSADGAGLVEGSSSADGAGLAERSSAATARSKAVLATPVAGVVGDCGTFGCPRPGHLHNGVDFLAAAGTPVRAARAGRVALLQAPGQSGGYGNFVCIQHRPALATCYAHLSAVAARVRPGARVRRRQIIGRVGATGSASTPHLHFEVRRGPATCQECAVDPLRLLARSAAPGVAAPAKLPPRAPAAPTRPGPSASRAPAPSTGGAPGAPATGPARPTGPRSRTPAPLVQATPARPERIDMTPDPVPSQPPAAAGPVPAAGAPAAGAPPAPTTAASPPG